MRLDWSGDIETFACDECGERKSGRPTETVTGRRLCKQCGDRFSGVAAGLLTGGGIGGAISTAGWFSKLRRRRTDS
ncbi:hypothetical protein [Frankia tisae]|uniref:hypothetical protein n=1 Tax=Frankia tisae TaxID=2950104 RepID=UPI0021BDF47A|nr:hypothetical protein [Frankia tisae]